MNKHIQAVKNLSVIALVLFYFAGVPAIIVEYGINNNIKAFDNGSPFSEVLQVFIVVWVGGSIVLFFVIYALYMIAYGCQKDDNDE